MSILVKYPNGKESLEFTAMMHCLSSGLKADHQRTIWEDHGKRKTGRNDRVGTLTVTRKGNWRRRMLC